MYLFFLYAVAWLIFWIKRIISSEKWFQTTSFFSNFFLKMPKIWMTLMHQSIPAAPIHPPPPGLLRGICSPCQSRGWGICKFCTAQAARHLPTPGPLASFSHARSFLSEYNYSEGFIGSSVKDRNKLKRVVKVWSQFYACISSLHIKIELDSKNRSYRCESTCFGY